MSFNQTKKPGLAPPRTTDDDTKPLKSLTDQVPDVSDSLAGPETDRQIVMRELRENPNMAEFANFLDECDLPDAVFAPNVFRDTLSYMREVQYFAKTRGQDAAAHFKKAREELVCPVCSLPFCNFPDSPMAAILGWNYRVKRVVRG